jgi:hypothetical protein
MDLGPVTGAPHRRTMRDMSEFWAGLAGVLVGGVLSLTGVWWTLRRQEQRDRKADKRALRDRKYDRLPAALLAVVDAASALSRRTLMLNIALLVGQNEGKWQRFNELVGQPYPSTTVARGISTAGERGCGRDSEEARRASA